MKPTPLRPLRPNRFLFTRGLGLVLLLRSIAAWSGWLAVVGWAGCIVIAGMAARGCVPA